MIFFLVYSFFFEFFFLLSILKQIAKKIRITNIIQSLVKFDEMIVVEKRAGIADFVSNRDLKAVRHCH